MIKWQTESNVGKYMINAFIYVKMINTGRNNPNFVDIKRQDLNRLITHQRNLLVDINRTLKIAAQHSSPLQMFLHHVCPDLAWHPTLLTANPWTCFSFDLSHRSKKEMGDVSVQIFKSYFFFVTYWKVSELFDKQNNNSIQILLKLH